MKKRPPRLVLVGQAPSRTGDPKTPLQGAVGKKLAALFGATTDEYIERTERRNVLNKFPGRRGKGDDFPKEKAEWAALGLCPVLDRRRVIMLGGNVASAFGMRVIEYLKWFSVKCKGGIAFEAAVLPHPSGINRWWNDPRNRRAARSFMRKAWRTTN